MEREEILREIAQLERDKARSPHMEASINAEITALCDRLRRLSQWKPRHVA